MPTPPQSIGGQAFDAYMAGLDPTAARKVDDTAVLPSLFLSHGAPPLFDDPEWIAELAAWARRLPTPRGILVLSAHWERAPITLSSTRAAAPLVYDFSGFHPRFSTMGYPTPDAGWMADAVEAALSGAGGAVVRSERGLDHGAWVPLKVMYPFADLPCLQLSIPSHHPIEVLELGRRLASLRDEGVLLIGSGFMTHGLPFLSRENFTDGTVPSWSAEFDAWAAHALGRGDLDELVRYAERAPGLPFAHPTVEHFTPLFLALGAAQDLSSLTTTVEGYRFGLSKRSFEVV